MEQVCEEVNCITERADLLDTLREVTGVDFIVQRTKGILGWTCNGKQFYDILTQKLTGEVLGFAQTSIGKGLSRGATTWKRVQIHATEVTQN